jgi:tRNA pseudouridine55 synthase
LNKPQGLTSRQALDRVKRLVRPAKTGHAGTLDPLATGVLVVCIGAATRLIQYVQRMPKSYIGTFLLGCSSDTEDIEGQVIEQDQPPLPSEEQILAAAAALVGTIQQRPPAYSALRVQGQRAYQLARKGTPPELEPRPVEIYQLDVVDYHYPRLTLRVCCGSGTYVRSLGRDLAESLGTAAVMSSLIRTAIGSFCVERSIAPDALNHENLPQLLVPPLVAVESLPRIDLSTSEVLAVRQGKTIARDFPTRPVASSLSLPASPTPRSQEEWAAVDPQGRLVALLVRREPALLGPICVLPEE